jgi:hypothetical protein
MGLTLKNALDISVNILNSIMEMLSFIIIDLKIAILTFVLFQLAEIRI